MSGSSKLTKITDGAVAFDGSGDSLKATDSSDFAFGTGEFTVEMFFYANTESGNDVLYDSRATTGNPTDGFSIVRNGNQLRTYTSGDYKITPSTFRVGTKRWYHLAITRESTTQKMYIDGELVGSATVSNDFSQPKATIGFAGRRVIQDTVRETLPDEFQTAEYVKDHGGIDLVVERQYLNSTIGTLLNVLLKKAESQAKQDSNVTVDKSLQAVS